MNNQSEVKTITIEKDMIDTYKDRNGCLVKEYQLVVEGKNYHVKVTANSRLIGSISYVAKDMNAPKFDDLENQERSEGFSFISEDEAIKDLFN